MFIYVHFLPAAEENEPKERRIRWRGLDSKKADKPHFCSLRHSPPYVSPSCCLNSEELLNAITNFEFHQSFPFGKGRLRDRALSFIKITATARN